MRRMRTGNRVGLMCLSLILISGCAGRSEPAPVESVYRGTSYYHYAPNSWSEETYTVRAGDTLYSIAFRASMDIRDIARLNNLTEPYAIYPNQVLRLQPETLTTPTAQPVSSAPQETNVNEGVATTSQTGYGENVSSTSQVETVAVASETTRAVAQPQAVVRPQISRPRSPEREVASADIRWRWPSSGRIVKRFSTREPMNHGMEFSGSRGDPVIAAAAGKVVYVGTALRGYGRLIILKHNDDYITAYGHNDTVLVQEQQWVESGQQIATMGKSGREDVRLRFELRLRGNSVNPENYLPRSR
ncbi:peptidase M23 [Aliidiomarina taiwanensis]|uniref:Peptidase M23 n=1 Tax=Aliidiomarina taiwanensis TaxID=946228 RepID=A0A432X9Z2_9GAMM|nr:peptidoglycan DD-metalloendopeptidase family protein [Aliidiomarina taiwanensis]RUO44218.1 peptidase M23 [Aliidiomarina taiwanensis]